MSDLSPEQEQYQKEYLAAIEALDAGAAPAIPPQEAEAAPETKPAEAEAPKVDEAAPVVDELAAAIARAERAEKQVQDNKAWATKEAMRRAELERQFEQQQRQANRPAFLEANPELEEAIKYVANDPAPRQQAETAHATWMQTIEAVHPGIFAADADKELVDALVAKREASGDAWSDPMVAIRDIADEKVAHAQRQAEKRYQVEAAQRQAKSAMSVPGTGGGGKREALDTQAEEVKRINDMSDSDFDKMVKKVKGF